MVQEALRVLSVREVRTCQYEIEASSPIVCRIESQEQQQEQQQEQSEGMEPHDSEVAGQKLEPPEKEGSKVETEKSSEGSSENANEGESQSQNQDDIPIQIDNSGEIPNEQPVKENELEMEYPRDYDFSGDVENAFEDDYSHITENEYSGEVNEDGEQLSRYDLGYSINFRTGVCTVFEAGDRTNSRAVECFRRAAGSNGFLVISSFVLRMLPTLLLNTLM